MHHNPNDSTRKRYMYFFSCYLVVRKVRVMTWDTQQKGPRRRWDFGVGNVDFSVLQPGLLSENLGRDEFLSRTEAWDVSRK